MKALKRLSRKGRSEDTLADTTQDKLRQCRSVMKGSMFQFIYIVKYDYRIAKLFWGRSEGEYWRECAFTELY